MEKNVWYIMQGWTSASVSQTVEVQPGEEVTLLCPNISIRPTQSDWFRVLNRTKPSCVSSIYGADGEASYCWTSASVSQTVEVQPGEEVTLLCPNISIRPTQSDWFRVLNRTKPSCVSSIYGADGEASYCNGESDYDEYDFETKKEPDEMTYLMSLILGCLAFLLTIVVIVLAVKIMKLQREWRILPKTIRSRRSAMENEVETHVVYAATK
ncbi:B-cell receptor CD22 [Dissostichus eleginoides]|uniref:B-cell receptor CD22 n=1 Tax=Dissostichus eleginoides TaxID=100907 RepID=A0AAD9BUM5_DISEL|nr:B-cell receptor CD22 [Dissostichus eleginoides]